MADSDMKRQFSGASDLIDFRKLEHETMRLLFLGLVVAVSFHAALASYFIFRQSEIKVMKPLTMELVIRKPRLTKPYEFKKEKKPKRILTNMRKIPEKAVPLAEMKIRGLPSILIGNVSSFGFLKEESFEGVLDRNYFFVPENLNIDLSILKKPDNTISMKEEMITIDDLDTGRYKALVIQDPKDKQNIKGFIYIATLWGTTFEPAYKKAIINVSDALNKYTKVRSKVDKHLMIDSADIFRTPFVYLAMDRKFELTEIEARNFGEYLRNGGFAVLENAVPEKDLGPAESSLRWMLKQSLGADAKFIPIPNIHPIYHCFFDFDDGPPVSDENEDTWVVRPKGLVVNKDQKQVYYLEGVWIKNRLVAVYSDKGYCKSWARDLENEPQLKMGVNLIIFALTQKGSIAQQLIEQFTAYQ